MKISLKMKFAIIAILSALVALIGFIISFGLIRDYIEDQETEYARAILIAIDREIHDKLDLFKNDVRLLSNLSALSELSSAEDSSVLIDEIQRTFLLFSREHKEYFQLRYIDENGQEIVRVDRKDKNSSVSIVPEDKLQNKKDRYYFQKSVNLSNNEVYISELDLNVEQEEVQVPYTPVIRFATPVFDKNGDNRGIIISNVFADKILDILNLSPYPSTFLIDQDGYYLYNSDDKEKEWGKSLGTEIKLEHFLKTLKQHEEAFRRSDFIDHEILFNSDNVDGKYFDYKIKYSDIDDERYWVLSAFIKTKSFFASYHNLQNRLIFLNFISIAIVIIIFILLTIKLLNPLKKIMKTVEYLNLGRYDVEADVKTKDELGEFSKKLNSLIRKVAQNEQERYELIRSASHQLRTPASVVRMNLDLLIEELQKNKQYAKNKELIENISNSNRTLITVLGDITKYLEIGENYFATHLKRVKIREVIDDILNSLAEQVESNKIDIQVKIPPKLTVLADENLFKNALIQLITNAVEYSNEGGKVSISAKRIDGYVEFEITDTGIGIPAKEQVHVFTKFFRAGNAYAKKNVGSGLGLVIAKIIIQGHGGKLKFKSRENKGTKFTFGIFDSSK